MSGATCLLSSEWTIFPSCDELSGNCIEDHISDISVNGMVSSFDELESPSYTPPSTC